ncbi:MAG: response regulator transcription factor [Oscillospiraceae bacterium]|nr:response regulator transcription factor [Oscillospiraceae bacterium]
MSLIYIVEDDKHIRELVIYALKSNGFDVVGFESGAEFYAKMQKNGSPDVDENSDGNVYPDLILLDIMLPGENGLSILKNIRVKPLTAGIPVIILTAQTGEYDKVTGLDLGADDYITKPFSVLELISRVKAVLRRMRSPNCEVLSCKGVELDVLKHTVKNNGEYVKLTRKEFELLQYLMQNRGMVLSRDRVIETIWDFDFEGESRTVDMHIKSLRKKLGENGGLIETVRGIGYKFEN